MVQIDSLLKNYNYIVFYQIVYYFVNNYYILKQTIIQRVFRSMDIGFWTMVFLSSDEPAANKHFE